MHAMSDLKQVQIRSSTILVEGRACTSTLHSNPHKMLLSFLAFGRHHVNAEFPSLVRHLPRHDIQSFDSKKITK